MRTARWTFPVDAAWACRLVRSNRRVAAQAYPNSAIPTTAPARAGTQDSNGSTTYASSRRSLVAISAKHISMIPAKTIAKLAAVPWPL